MDIVTPWTSFRKAKKTYFFRLKDTYSFQSLTILAIRSDTGQPGATTEVFRLHWLIDSLWQFLHFCIFWRWTIRKLNSNERQMRHKMPNTTQGRLQSVLRHCLTPTQLFFYSHLLVGHQEHRKLGEHGSFHLTALLFSDLLELNLHSAKFTINKTVRSGR